MTDDVIDSVASRWARLGVMLNVRPAPQTPDIELLLLDTARVAPSNTRLFTLAATWLSIYAEYVDVHRLALLIHNELEGEHQPALGLILETADQHTRPGGSAFGPAIEVSNVATDPMPLADVERRNPLYRRLAEQRAAALSRKWGRWVSDLELQLNALRPAEWVRSNNPSLVPLQRQSRSLASRGT